MDNIHLTSIDTLILDVLAFFGRDHDTWIRPSRPLLCMTGEGGHMDHSKKCNGEKKSSNVRGRRKRIALSIPFDQWKR